MPRGDAAGGFLTNRTPASQSALTQGITRGGCGDLNCLKMSQI